MHTPSQKSVWPFVLTILLVAFGYAVIRYHLVKGTPWEDFPLFISNKAISLASLGCIALSYMLGPLARFWASGIVPLLVLRKPLGSIGFGLGALHGLLSLLQFNPATYPKFFAENGAVNLTGELSMIFGVLAFFIFAGVAYSSQSSVAAMLGEHQWIRIQRLGYLGLLLIFFHVLTMGLDGWMQPDTWPGGLLPISLVAAIIAAAAVLLRIVVLLFPSREYRETHS